MNSFTIRHLAILVCLRDWGPQTAHGLRAMFSSAQAPCTPDQTEAALRGLLRRDYVAVASKRVKADRGPHRKVWRITARGKRALTLAIAALDSALAVVARGPLAS